MRRHPARLDEVVDDAFVVRYRTIRNGFGWEAWFKPLGAAAIGCGVATDLATARNEARLRISTFRKRWEGRL